MNIDQKGLNHENSDQNVIADYYAYLELKKLGYTDTELFKQFNHVMKNPDCN